MQSRSTSPVTDTKTPSQNTQTLARSVTAIKGIGPKIAEALERLSITTIGDLLTHYPRRYEDRARFTPISQIPDAQPVTLTGKVTAVENRPTKTKMVITKVTVDDGSRTLATLTWFNNWRMKQTFEPLIGKRVVAYGVAKRAYASVEMVQPEWEPLDDGDSTDSLSIGRIVPVYPATEGVTQKLLRKAIYLVLERFREEATDVLPPSLQQKHRFPALATALQTVHFPESMDALASARYRLVYEELLIMQLLLLGRRQAAQAIPGIAFKDIDNAVQALEAVLPFTLTDAQKRVIEEIGDDMATPLPMNRLIQGDVGSGKTAVAMAAMAIRLP